MKKSLFVLILFILFFSIGVSAWAMELPASLLCIEEEAFAGIKNMGEVKLPEGVVTIGPRVFANSTLTSLYLPESVRQIDEHALQKARIGKLEAPVGSYAYNWAVEHGYIPHASPAPAEDFTWTVVDDYVRIDSYTGSAADLVFPAEINGYPVKAIADWALQNNGTIERLELPESFTRIGWGSFANMSCLRSIILPDSVTYIGRYAFENCKKLDYFRYPLQLTAVDGSGEIFKGCVSLKRIDVPESVTRLPDNVFCNARSLEEVHLPSTLKEIGNHAFNGCAAMEEIEIPDGVEIIGSYTFYNMTKLKALNLPDSVTTIYDGAFTNCESLASFRYPMGLKSISNHGLGLVSVFRGCKALKRVDIPEGVTRIPDSLFRAAEYLEHVHLPSTLKEIGGRAFDSCTAMEEIEIPDGVEIIDSYAFSGMTKLKELNLPDSVTTIYDGAFSYCESLASFHYPLGLDTVTEHVLGHFCVFNGCKSLKRIDVPEGITKIPNYLFRYAEALEEVNLPMSLREVGERAFEGASAIREVYLNEYVYSIGEYSFNETTLTINCEWDTYALRYAIGKNLPYFYLSRTGQYSLNGAHWPSGTLYRGDEYLFDGYVRSSLNVDNVKGAIYSAAGEQLRSADYDPAETDHALAGAFTNAMDIAGLGLGSYRFTLEAAAGDKQELLVDETFRIVPPPLRVRCEGLDIPRGFYAEAESIPLGGTIISNYPIEIVFGAFNGDGSWTTQVYSGAPGTFSYDLASAGLNMNALDSGSYQFLITVSGNNESKVVACSDFTRSGIGLDGLVDSDFASKVEHYVSNQDNKYIFSNMKVDYRWDLQNVMTDQDKCKLIMFTSDDKVRGELIDLIRSSFGDDVRRSDYLVQVYKKEIASFVQSQGKLDGIPYQSPDHEKLVKAIVDGNIDLAEFICDPENGDLFIQATKIGREVSQSYKALCKLIKGAQTAQDLAEIFADAMRDYSRGVQVLDAIASQTVSGADYDYNFQLALREMQEEYTNNCIRLMNKVVTYVVNEGTEEAVSTLIEAVIGGRANLVLSLAEIGWAVFTEQTDFYGDIEEIVTYYARVETFYGAYRSYQEAFEAIAQGRGDQYTAARMVNAFRYAKEAIWRSFNTLDDISYYSAITSDVNLNQVRNALNRLNCP